MGLTDPVLGWDQRFLFTTDPSISTVPSPAGSQAVEMIEMKFGAARQGNARPQQDKTQGRDRTLKFVEGRVDPIGFSGKTSVKSRAAVDTVPKESPFYKAAGMIETVTGGVNVAYSFTSAPTPAYLVGYGAMGATPIFAEQGLGGVVKKLRWDFGDNDLLLSLDGAWAEKYHLGSVDSATVADGVTPSVVLAAGEGQRFQIGWYQWESEIIKVTAIATDTLTILRGQLASAAAAHAAKPITPYIPALTLAGSPISEANCTVTFDAVATRVMKGYIELDTGGDHLPHETGSATVQGSKWTRYTVKGSLDLVLTRQLVDLFGKTRGRKTVACTVVCGTGVGGIVTFSMPTLEVRPFPADGPKDDIVVVTVPLDVRGNAGNDSFSMIVT